MQSSWCVCVCVLERLDGVGGGDTELGVVCLGGVVCAFCVWLPCLPVITPRNLAVKGWP